MVVPIIMAAATVASVGMQIWGASEAKKAQKEQARIAGEKSKLAKQQIDLQAQGFENTVRGQELNYENWVSNTQLEKRGEDIRKSAMELNAGRSMLESVRAYQRARSMSLVTAQSQGAQGGSGLIGAYGQAAGQTAWNVGNVHQQLGFGNELFHLNRQSTLAKEQLAEQLYGLQKGNNDITRRGFGLAKIGADLDAQMVAAGGKAADAAGITAIGSTIGSTAGQLGRIGGNFFGGSSSSGGGSPYGTSMGFDVYGPGM